MADEDVRFKLKKLKIKDFSRSQVHILYWLVLKSPNLIDLQIYKCTNKIEREGLDI